MDLVLSTFKEKSKRKILRLAADQLVDFKNGKFYWKKNGKEIENI